MIRSSEFLAHATSFIWKSKKDPRVFYKVVETRPRVLFYQHYPFSASPDMQCLSIEEFLRHFMPVTDH